MIIQFFKRLFGFPIIQEFNDGLILQDPSPEDWQFGAQNAIQDDVIRPDGQWIDLLPDGERQKKRRVDTFACVSFATLNIIEILLKAKGIETNRSDRYTAKMSGTTRSGNTYINVAKSVRKDGTVDEVRWEFGEDFTWEKFYEEIPREIVAQGNRWLTEYDVNYEFIKFSPDTLMRVLKYSPIMIGVYAWAEKNGKYFFPKNGRYTHATVLVGYKKGEYWLVFDSYEPFLKKLEWNYPIYKWAMRFGVKVLKEKSAGQKLYERFKGSFIILPEQYGEVYYVSPQRELEKVTFAISNEILFKRVHEALREKKMFTGLSNKNFELLKEYVVSMGGKVVDKQGGVRNGYFIRKLYNA